jgi:hypothetical protein
MTEIKSVTREALLPRRFARDSKAGVGKQMAKAPCFSVSVEDNRIGERD